MKQRLTISLEPEDYRRLCVLARTEDRSLSWLVGRALSTFLDDHAIAEQLPMPVRQVPARSEAMTDTVSSRTRSRIMSAIRSVDTSPERLVRSYLHRRGFRFRKNVATLPGTPDVVLKRYSATVFVHGCFWHQHPDCRDGHVPASNTDYWLPKLKRTQERDRAHQHQLRAAGWRVFIVWECELCPATLQALAENLVSALNRA